MRLEMKRMCPFMGGGALDVKERVFNTSLDASQ